jgi:predicted dehydrogenase
MNEVRLITLDPGHFHAALVQKEMYDGVAKQVHVYAPLGVDLAAHVSRIAGFNSRAERPTDWNLEIHAGADFLDRFQREKPGNVAVLSGRNRGKIDRILAAVRAGLNVLADKPWVIETEDLPKLDEALRVAEENGLVAYDIMTERYEITSILQREFVQDAAVFGEIVRGTPAQPGVYFESVHFLSKLVAGVPLRRPAWFFDVAQQGEGLTDVGTHLVDLVPWILFPGQALDPARDVAVLSATRKPTPMTAEQFQKVTGEGFPPFLASAIKDGRLDYFCNTYVTYAIRGVHVKLDVLWGFESPGGGDTHFAAFGGSRSRVEVRQRKEENYRPELYVIPNNPAERAVVQAAVERRFAALQPKFPGLSLSVPPNGEIWVRIPDTYRTGHEAHFGEVTRQFLEYLKSPGSLPAWERPNMLAKYHTTTQGVRLARETNA